MKIIGDCKKNNIKSIASYLPIVLLSLAVGACGGGSSAGNDENSAPPTNTNNSETDTNNGGGDSTDTGPNSASESDAGANTPETVGGSGPSVNATGGGNITLVGSVDFDQIDDFDSASASFQRVDPALNSEQIQNTILPDSDTCSIFEGSINLSGTFPNFDNISFNGISAGDVLTLTSPSGTFAELVREDDNGFISYEIANDNSALPGPVPAGTVIDIPGDEYPAFSNVAIPSVAPLTNVALSPASPVITPNSSISWTPSSNASSVLNLSAVSIQLPDFSDPNFDPANLDSQSITSQTVSCTLVDDGSFTYPASVQAALGSGFMSDGFTLFRSSHSFVQRGNAILVVTALSNFEQGGSDTQQ